MARFVIGMEEVEHLSLKELTQSIQKSQALLSVTIPCPNLSWARSNVDIAYDYLEAVMIGDALTPLCRKIKGEVVSAPDHENSSGRHAHRVRFNLSTSEPEKLAERLVELAIHFKAEPDMDEEVDVAEELSQYESDLLHRGTRFPDLADSYLANWMHGGGMRFEDWESLYSSYPERRYGFWKSFHSSALQFDFYVSDDAYVLPRDANLLRALRVASNLKGKTNLLRARCVAVGEEPESVQHEQGIFFFPRSSIENARRCANAVFVEPLRPLVEDGRITEGGTLINGRIQATATLHTPQGNRSLAPGLAQALNGQNPIEEVLISEEGTVLVVRDGIAQYVMFNLTVVTGVDLQNHLNLLGETLETMRKVSGEDGEFSLPWHELSDEAFEDLCYDVIRCCGRYYGDSVRKMGKTKSRDGGRDLLFESCQEPFYWRPATKWIGQCKLIRNGGSLTAQLQISDVIDQFDAGGYCVLTSGLIDATLHDKLAAIGRKKNIATDQWDKMRLERFLAQRPEIHDRYFPRPATGS